MREFMSDFWNDDRGITSVEYALLLSFVAAGLMVAATVLSGAVVNQMGDAADCIKGGASACQ